MAKLGSPYQDLVSTVASAAHPVAKVTVGDWIEGPDGEREIDVRIESLREGSRHFILIECKDKKRPVGIADFDALDSKRRDLSANQAMLFSNSGFTRDALAKAQRVGIDAVSALVAGDKRVRVRLSRLFVAKRRAVRRASITIYPIDGSSVPEAFDWRDLHLGRLPLINWAEKHSAQILPWISGRCAIVGRYAFAKATEFSLLGDPIVLKGIDLLLECDTDLVSQQVSVDATTGYFDHAKKRVIIPPQQAYLLAIDQKAWKPFKGIAPNELCQEPGTFELYLDVLHPVQGIASFGTPDLDSIVSEFEITQYSNKTLGNLGIT